MTGALGFPPPSPSLADGPAQTQDGPEAGLTEGSTEPAPRRSVWHRLSRRPGSCIALIYLVVVGLAAIAAPLVAPFDPYKQDLVHTTQTPSGSHWLGTDSYGRDLLSRLIFGGRTSLGVAVCVVGAALIVALPIGLIAGYKGGRIDGLLMRLTDAALSIPAIVLALAIAGALGPGVTNGAVALSIVYVPSIVRLIRGEVVQLRHETYVEASKVAGTGTWRILLRRILPNIRSTLLVASAFWLGTALLAEAALSYLGVGAQAPTASWGNMLRQAYDNSLFTSAWQSIVPGMAIALTILAFNTLGDGLRDVLGAGDSRAAVRRGVRRVRTTRRPRPGTPADSAGRSGATDTDAVLAIDGLSIAFATPGGEDQVLSGVSLTVGPGEVVGLVGESGSGKTVTALSILRLLPSSARIVSGSIQFQGTDLLTLRRKELTAVRGAGIGMIFQDPLTALDPSFTVGHQLAEAMLLHGRCSAREARRRAVEMLDRVQIPAAAQRVRDYPHQLSGGMRQRVMIAMALACEPKLLIADEPTTALDVTVQAQILDLLRQLQSELQMSILFVTHDLGVVSGFCDRVSVMYAGQVVETAPAPDFFARPLHPYGEGLITAVPHANVDRKERLAVIPGMVPLVSNMPSGCRFHPRCRYAEAACVDGPPQLRIDGEREVRCRRSEQLHLEGVE